MNVQTPFDTCVDNLKFLKIIYLLDREMLSLVDDKALPSFEMKNKAEKNL